MQVTQCHNIVINTPGHVQQFGYLLGINLETLSVEFYSENINDLFILPENILNQPIENLPQLSSLFSNPILQEVIADDKELSKNSGKITIADVQYHLTAYQIKAVIFIEFEKCIISNNSLEIGLKDVKKLIALKEGEQIWNALVKDIAQITGYERVMIYKFHFDGSGRVIAEEKRDHLESFMNLHYPESDIPQQARKLYLKNYKRIISDVNSPVVPIIGKTNEIDLTYSGIRAISPIHLEYLKNGNVESSFSISIIIENKLWGLVTCHNSTAKHIDLDARILSEIATFIAANSYHSYQSGKAVKYEKELAAKCFDLKMNLLEANNATDGILKHADYIRDLSETDGFVAIIDGQIIPSGILPDDNTINTIAGWVRIQPVEDFYYSNSLYSEFHQHLSLDLSCAGIAACFLNESKTDMLIWFRQEYKDHIEWAGKPIKQLKTLNFFGEDQLTFSPRHSMATYIEQVTNKSLPWSKKDIKRLQAIKLVIDQCRKEYVYQIERTNRDLNELNKELKRLNEELDSYSRTISHDLSTPLTVMKLNMQMMARLNTNQTAIGQIQNVLNEIDNMSEMMINVLKLSRLKHGEFEFHTLNPSPIIQKVCVDSKLTYNEDADIEIGDLYNFVGDKNLVQQVFQNIINNAVKYSSNRSDAKIKITSKLDGEEVVYMITDNGIGIPYEDKKEVFKVFTRMDNSRNYFGNGVGLSIVDRVMTKLGGSVDFDSTLDVGTTFYLRFQTVQNSD